MLVGARVAGGQFGAATPLGVRTDTRCEAGTDNWKIHDPYRSQCSVEVVAAYSVDVPPLPAVSDLDARLKAERWSLGERTLTDDLGPVVSLEARNQLARVGCGMFHGGLASWPEAHRPDTSHYDQCRGGSER